MDIPVYLDLDDIDGMNGLNNNNKSVLDPLLPQNLRTGRDSFFILSNYTSV